MTLAGTGSDPDAGDTLAYRWTQTGGETVALSGADAATATFTAPARLRADGTLTFSLKVTDAGNLHHTDTVSVTVQAAVARVSPVATVSASETLVTEGAIASFEVRLNTAAAGTISVPVTVLETGNTLSSLLPSAIELAAGERVGSVRLPTVDDQVIEADSRITLTLGAGAGFELGTPVTAAMTVADNDTAAFRIRAADTQIDEGGSTSVTVEITNGKEFAEQQPIPLTTSGSASASDYVLSTTTPMLVARAGSVSATLSAVDDGEAEPAETVTVTASHAGAVIGSATITIRASSEDPEEPEEAEEGDVRLVNGSGAHEGRVEIYHEGRWGTVCDDFWRTDNATVVCRQLGYSGRGKAHRRAAFGEGEDPIWMDNVRCSGDEARLADCPFRGWGVHNCSHAEDAGVSCGAGASAATADATVLRDALTLHYRGSLSSGSVPSPSDFVVLATAGTSADEVPVDRVTIAGSKAVLGLSRAVLPTEAVTVSYLAAPMHPIEDDQGNPVAPFHNVAVRHAPGLGLGARHPAEQTATPSGALEIWPEDRQRELWSPARYGASKRERIDLSSRRLSDLSQLRSLSDLEVLNLGDNEISDLAALSMWTELDELDLSNNRIEILYALSGLTHLRSLDLSNNRITDVSALSGLIHLRRLDLSNNRITDISALASLPRLEVLLLGGNRVDDPWTLSTFRTVVNLGLSGNEIADLTPFAGLPLLRRLDLSVNRIQDLGALAAFPGLSTLRLRGNPAIAILPLQDAMNLRWVWLNADMPGARGQQQASKGGGPPYLFFEDSGGF